MQYQVAHNWILFTVHSFTIQYIARNYSFWCRIFLMILFILTFFALCFGFSICFLSLYQIWSVMNKLIKRGFCTGINFVVIVKITPDHWFRIVHRNFSNLIIRINVILKYTVMNKINDDRHGTVKRSPKGIDISCNNIIYKIIFIWQLYSCLNKRKCDYYLNVTIIIVLI